MPLGPAGANPASSSRRASLARSSAERTFFLRFSIVNPVRLFCGFRNGLHLLKELRDTLELPRTRFALDQRLREPGRRGMLEDIADRGVDAQQRVNVRDQLGRQQGVAAQGEEAVVNAD